MGSLFVHQYCLVKCMWQMCAFLSCWNTAFGRNKLLSYPCEQESVIAKLWQMEKLIRKMTRPRRFKNDIFPVLLFQSAYKVLHGWTADHWMLRGTMVLWQDTDFKGRLLWVDQTQVLYLRTQQSKLSQVVPSHLLLMWRWSNSLFWLDSRTVVLWHVNTEFSL